RIARPRGWGPLRAREQSPRGVSVVLDPTGPPLGGALCRDEGILYARIDLAQSVEPKQFHDVVGSYNRFDIFTLTVDRSPRRPATFIDEARDSARRGDRGMRGRKSGPAAWFGRLLGGPDRRLGVLAAALLASVVPLLLLLWICQEVFEAD